MTVYNVFIHNGSFLFLAGMGIVKSSQTLVLTTSYKLVGSFSIFRFESESESVRACMISVCPKTTIFHNQ